MVKVLVNLANMCELQVGVGSISCCSEETTPGETITSIGNDSFTA